MNTYYKIKIGQIYNYVDEDDEKITKVSGDIKILELIKVLGNYTILIKSLKTNKTHKVNPYFIKRYCTLIQDIHNEKTFTTSSKILGINYYLLLM